MRDGIHPEQVTNILQSINIQRERQVPPVDLQVWTQNLLVVMWQCWPLYPPQCWPLRHAAYHVHKVKCRRTWVACLELACWRIVLWSNETETGACFNFFSSLWSMVVAASWCGEYFPGTGPGILQKIDGIIRKKGLSRYILSSNTSRHQPESINLVTAGSSSRTVILSIPKKIVTKWHKADKVQSIALAIKKPRPEFSYNKKEKTKKCLQVRRPSNWMRVKLEWANISA